MTWHDSGEGNHNPEQRLPPAFNCLSFRNGSDGAVDPQVSQILSSSLWSQHICRQDIPSG
eukprot:5740920-Amphidinium_carterae.1